MEGRMEERYIEGVANHDDPESCASFREGVGEALTGVRNTTGIERVETCVLAYTGWTGTFARRDPHDDCGER